MGETGREGDQEAGNVPAGRLEGASAAHEEQRQARKPRPEQRGRLIKWRIWAVVLTLLLGPGFGHFILRRIRRGSIWFAGAWILIALTPLSVLFLFAGFLGARLAAAVDAALAPVAPARLELPAAAKLGLALFLVHAVVVGVVRTQHLEAFKIPSGGMIPTLQIGDHIMVNKLAYVFGEVERGDLVVFVHPCEPAKDFIKRVVAVGGDTVEVRCDVLWINGEPIPAEPVKGTCEYWDFDYAAERWVQQGCSRYRETVGKTSYHTIHRPSRPGLDRERASGSGDILRFAGEQDFPDHRAPGCLTPRAGAPTGRIESSEGGEGVCASQRHYVVPKGHVFVMGDNRSNSSDSRRWGPVPVDYIKGEVTSIWYAPHPGGQGAWQWNRIGAVE